MANRRFPHLTKSKYVTGLQCHLRLWKQVFSPLPYKKPVPGTPQYEGTRIGELARTLFPGGLLVDNEAYDHKGALERTKALIAEGCPAIFEGAFEHDNRRIRVDILKNVGDEKWALYEVKSSTSIHDEHFDDAAFQADVLRRSGIDLISVSIVHVDREYRRGPAGIDMERFFRISDISDQLTRHYENLSPNLETMNGILSIAEPPDIPPGLHCRKPYACEFEEQCHAALPKDWVGHLPRVTQERIDQMSLIGVTKIGDIPNLINLRGAQAVMRNAHKTGVPFVSPTIQDELLPLRPPALYLDFESMMPGLPLYAETGPYQHIPFLFSLHLNDGSALSHSDYIAPPGDDPRRAFAEELIRQTASAKGPIVVYSAYEKRIINELARDFPDLDANLKKIIERLQDLLGIVRKTVYLPAFNGSFSIKDVAPVLADVSYEGLEIKDGSTAATRYQKLVETSALTSDEVEKTLTDLRAYCARDTLAMVGVHQALIALTGSPRNLEGA